MIELYKNKIIFGNCNELLQQLPEQSVDLFLEDMPYNTTACHWEYEVDLVKYWEIRKKLIKPTGVFVLTASQPFTSRLVMSNENMFRYEWIWEKGKQTNFLNVKYRPLGEHENIVVFGGNRYNPIMKELTINGIKRNNREKNASFKNTKSVYGDTTDLEVMQYKGKTQGYPKTIIKFNSEANNQFETQVFHPTQKPVGLFEYLIKTYTNKGDLVVDGYAGSGTTAVAAIRNNRNFICFENDKEYFAIAEERIKKEMLKTNETCYTEDLELFKQ